LDINTVITQIAGKDNVSPGDFTDSEGFLVCGKCRTRKQHKIKQILGSGDMQKVPVMCDCLANEYSRQKERERLLAFQQRIQVLRRNGLSDLEYRNWTFDKDDRKQPGISDACRKYVDEWNEMRDKNVGLLFYGGVGTGKSFYACCIANALLERCVSVLVTSFPRILGRLQSAGQVGDRNKLLDSIQRYELVVIDDLGAERETEYALEQIYTVVDTRYRSGKPLILTTNLAPSDIKASGNIGYERIYDRILQNSIPVKVSGSSRRTGIAAEKRKKHQSLLGL